MKNYLILFAIAGAISLVACKKDYTCVCSFTELDETTTDTLTQVFIKTTEKDAKPKCEALQTTVIVPDTSGTTTDTLSTACRLLGVD